MSESNQYQEQANKFLAEHGLEFRAVLIGSDCPPFCEDADKQIAMEDVDKYPRRTHIHGKHYRCTFSRKGRGHITFDFWNSYSDEEFNYVRTHASDMSFQTLNRVLGPKGYHDGALGILPLKLKPRTVSAYDLLTAIVKSDPRTFHDFCQDFGYDEDSRKAEQTYHNVVREWDKVRKFFTAEELAAVQEIR